MILLRFFLNSMVVVAFRLRRGSVLCCFGFYFRTHLGDDIIILSFEVCDLAVITVKNNPKKIKFFQDTRKFTGPSSVILPR